MAAASHAPSLKEKSSFGPIMEKEEVHDDRSAKQYLSAGPFDTPKTLSRATSREHSQSPPSRPCPAVVVPPKLTVDTTQRDLEKGSLSRSGSFRDLAPSPLWSLSREYSFDARTKECNMWPSKETLKSKARLEKCHRRRKNCFGLSKRWGEMDKRKRLIAKLLLALLIVSIAVGVAIGISRAVGGGVWAGQSKSKQIPGSH